MAQAEAYEVAIVGGGPAGLSAALVLGRCGRRVVLFDDGRYRNGPAAHVHGYLTRDGTPPAELRELGLAEVARYPTVERRRGRVSDAERDGDRFRIRSSAGEVTAIMVLLATGLEDTLPGVDGAAELVGERLFHCPYCDAWELRDQPLAVLAQPDDRGAQFALTLSQWSGDLVLYTDELRAGDELAGRLAARGIVIDRRVPNRVSRDGAGIRLHFAGGEWAWRRALFFHLGARQRCDLAVRLGCRLDDLGGVEVDRRCSTGAPGVYVAGDSSRDILQAIVAAGEGAAAAVAINRDLIERGLFTR
jgi:thioredoxin reductase